MGRANNKSMSATPARHSIADRFDSILGTGRGRTRTSGEETSERIEQLLFDVEESETHRVRTRKLRSPGFGQTSPNAPPMSCACCRASTRSTVPSN